MKVSVRESFLPSGMRTVVLENEKLIITLLPNKGADIYSVNYKALNHLNVLYRSPWSAGKPGMLQQSGTSEEMWMDRYHGGWQTMFPNAGSACSYKGGAQGFHGEASMVPWEYQIDRIDEISISVIFSVSLTRTPFKVWKTITLYADEAVVRIKERIMNHGEEEMDYIWGQHIVFGAPFLDESCVLHVPNDRMLVDSGQQGEYCRMGAGDILSWPMVRTRSGDTIDFSKVPNAEERAADMLYLTGMQESWYVLGNKKLQLNVGVSWDLNEFPYVWLWQEFRGTMEYPFHGRGYAMGVEPCSTPLPDGLVDSVKKGLSSRLAAGAAKETEFAMVFFEGADIVKSITRDGTVTFI